MTNNHKLTEGILETIMSGGRAIDPIVQVLGSKNVTSGIKDSERYRLLLSDGKYKVNIAMYTVKVKDQVITSALELHSIIKLKRFVSNVIKNKDRDMRVLLILELELVAAGSTVGYVIGNPVILTDSDNSSSQSSELSNTTPTRKKPRLQGLSEGIIISPIASLNPFHNKWVIRARVINKTNIRNWCNAKGEGKLFSVDLVDRSGEIRCTAFRDLVDKFFERLEVDCIYYITKCALKPINRQYCSLKHNFEMIFTQETQIDESPSDDDVPKVQYNFTTIDKVAVMEAGTVVDVIGVCKSISDVHTFTSKTTNRELKKREVLLIDQSKTAIALILWSTNAESFNCPDNPVLSVKSAKIYEFQGIKSMSFTLGTRLKINPDLPETQILRMWFDSEGNHVEVKNVSASSNRIAGGEAAWMSFRQVQQYGLTPSDRALYFQTLGTIFLVRLDRAVYKACPTTDCQKKVVDLENGMYRCEKCNREFGNFKYRLLTSMNVSDANSNQWITVFSSEAEKILGKTAHEIGEAMENDQDSVAKLFEDVQFKQFVFKCRAKVEIFNDEQRLKIVAVAVNPVDFEEHNTYLLKEIEKYRGYE